MISATISNINAPGTSTRLQWQIRDKYSVQMRRCAVFFFSLSQVQDRRRRKAGPPERDDVGTELQGQPRHTHPDHLRLCLRHLCRLASRSYQEQLHEEVGSDDAVGHPAAEHRGPGEQEDGGGSKRVARLPHLGRPRLLLWIRGRLNLLSFSSVFISAGFPIVVS